MTNGELTDVRRRPRWVVPVLVASLVAAFVVLPVGVFAWATFAPAFSCPSPSWAEATNTELLAVVPVAATGVSTFTSDCDDRRAVTVSFQVSGTDEAAAEQVDARALPLVGPDADKCGPLLREAGRRAINIPQVGLHRVPIREQP